MNRKPLQASTYEDATRFLEAYGDFHDATLLRLVQDYSKGDIDVHLDDVFSGLEGHVSRSGVLRLEGVELLLCQIPFVGGQVRIEGIELQRTDRGFSWSFQLTTTEWLNTDDFRVIRLVAVVMAVRLLQVSE